MIPTKSAARYEKAYAKFQDWRLLKLGSLTVALSDNIVSAYLYAGSMKGSKKASTLFCESAKLKKMLFYRDAATAQYFGAGCNVVINMVGGSSFAAAADQQPPAKVARE